MTRNDDFDGVGSLASRWISAVKLLEEPLLRTSITLVVKAPLLYGCSTDKSCRKGEPYFFQTLQRACPVKFTVEIGSKDQRSNFGKSFGERRRQFGETSAKGFAEGLFE
jgi:uncharacterized lipoprotein YajG